VRAVFDHLQAQFKSTQVEEAPDPRFAVAPADTPAPDHA
jgi:hypothetical protein